jgi:hypothetical protein
MVIAEIIVLNKCVSIIIFIIEMNSNCRICGGYCQGQSTTLCANCVYHTNLRGNNSDAYFSAVTATNLQKLYEQNKRIIQLLEELVDK